MRSCQSHRSVNLSKLSTTAPEHFLDCLSDWVQMIFHLCISSNWKNEEMMKMWLLQRKRYITFCENYYEGRRFPIIGNTPWCCSLYIREHNKAFSLTVWNIYVQIFWQHVDFWVLAALPALILKPFGFLQKSFNLCAAKKLLKQFFFWAAKFWCVYSVELWRGVEDWLLCKPECRPFRHWKLLNTNRGLISAFQLLRILTLFLPPSPAYQVGLCSTSKQEMSNF